MMNDRRDFIKKSALACAGALALPHIDGFAAERKSKNLILPSGFVPEKNKGLQSKLIVPKNGGLPITATFLDEISHDIPHQNWGEAEWDLDFQNMKAIGIDTVILIRSGYKKFITFPSKYLLGKGCYMPSVDLLEMFLSLLKESS